MKLILASGSPRRSEILKNAGYEFVVKPTSADESLPGGILPEDAVKLLSERKADAAKIECSDVVLSADTVVALGDRILGKPSDKAEAFSMLRSLSGKTHSVYTGVTIKSAEKKRVFAVKTDVLFYPLTDDEINAYIATGEPFDKAGAYGIQGRAAVFVEKIDGDYYSVVGLPLSRCSLSFSRNSTAEARDLSPFIAFLVLSSFLSISSTSEKISSKSIVSISLRGLIEPST